MCEKVATRDVLNFFKYVLLRKILELCHSCQMYTISTGV